MKRKLFLVCLLALIIGASCKKDTKEINHNFFCKLNGKKWYPNTNGDWKLKEAEAHLTDNGSSLFIKAANRKSLEDIGIAIYTPNVKIVVGTYSLNNIQTPFGYYDKNEFKGEYRTQAGYEGVLEIIKIDKTTKRISGRFYFNAYNDTTSDNVSITEGEFNLEYYDF